MSALPLLHRLLERRALGRAESAALFGAIMKGEVSPVQIAAILAALRVKGETVDEITGAAVAMREAAVAVRTERKPVVDTCGTGGDGKSFFNISTAAAFVVAGAGFTVAKHGNRSVSSACGSADVLEALGISMEASAAKADDALNKLGFAFLYAPSFHPAMKHAMPVRKELATRTIFNLLGPLSNPARPHAQLVGVFDPLWLKPLAEALKRLGTEAAFVVHGQGEDEISMTGPTDVAELYQGTVRTESWRPEDFGYKTLPREEGSKKSAPEFARTLLEVLNGRLGYLRNAVCMNAGAAIRAAIRTRAGGGKNLSLREAAVLAQKSIDTRAALKKFEEYKLFLAPEEGARV